MSVGDEQLKLLSRVMRESIEIRPMTQNDIVESRRVGQEAWSDLVSRDLGRKVLYPARSRRIIETYMWKEPRGCLVVLEDGEIIGNAFSHVWGKVGWVGPIEILPNSQNKGIGRMLLAECEAYLASKECRVIGVETMPHVPKNLHFYFSCGYRTSRLTLISEKPLRIVERVSMPDEVRELKPVELDGALPRIAELSNQVNPFLDFSIEFLALSKKNLGQCFVLERDDEIMGAALLHSYNRSGDTNYSSIKLVLLDDTLREKEKALRQLVTACEVKALELGKKRMYTRFSSYSPKLYNAMTQMGYRLASTNIRVIKDGDFEEISEYHISSWAG